MHVGQTNSQFITDKALLLGQGSVDYTKNWCNVLLWKLSTVLSFKKGSEIKNIAIPH